MNGILTKTSKIYRTRDGLACDIPVDVLPSATKHVWEDTTYVEPGHYQTIPGWLYVTVGAHPSTRLTLSHRPDIPPAQELISRGLDPTKVVQIRAYRSNAWLTCHPLHTTRCIDEKGLYNPLCNSPPKPVYGRATFPVYFPIKYDKDWSARLKELWRKEKIAWSELYAYIRNKDTYAFQVRGTTLPRQVKRGRWRTVREDFGVKYLNNIYPVTEYEENVYRWNIPTHLRCFSVLDTAFRLGYQPEVEFYPVSYTHLTLPTIYSV